MKHILIYILLTAAAAAQGNIDVRTYAAKYADISLYQYTDSALIATIPANSELRAITLICDSAFAGGETDSIKVGVQGEDVPFNDSFRFADIAFDSLSNGDIVRLSHRQYRMNSRGGLYAYEAEIAVVCTDAETYYPLTNLWSLPTNNFDTSGSGSALIVKKYRDGFYQINVACSFSANKAALAHFELFLNTAGYDYAAIERTISTGAQTGAAGTVGDIWLAAGDSVGVQFQSGSAGTTFTVNHAQIVALHDYMPEPYRTGATARNIMLYCGANTGRFRFVIEYVTIP